MRTLKLTDAERHRLTVILETNVRLATNALADKGDRNRSLSKDQRERLQERLTLDAEILKKLELPS